MLETHEVAKLTPIALRSLVADFRAAVWCEQRVDEVDDALLLADFHQIHESFVRAIGRSRPNLFRDVARPFLVEVTRKWVTMYCRAVAETRARFPRTDDSADVVVAGRNWSERLGIAYEGLDRLDVVSRYAEYWAERTVTWAVTSERGQGVQESFAHRLAFIGSRYYVLAEELMHSGGVMLVDQADNGMTSFDMWALFRAMPHPVLVEEHCALAGWRVSTLDATARSTLWEAARRTPAALGEAHDEL